MSRDSESTISAINIQIIGISDNSPQDIISPQKYDNCNVPE